MLVLILFVVIAVNGVKDFGNDGLTMYAPFDMKGLVGNVTFHQQNPEDNVTISIHLTLLGYDPDDNTTEPESFKWSVESFPVKYDTKDLCHRNDIGRSIHQLNDRHGDLTVPSNQSTTEFTDTELSLVGSDTIWGRSLLLTSSKRTRFCATIFSLNRVKTAMAKIHSPIAGEIFFRENENGDTTIFSNLFHVGEEYTTARSLPWRILVSDVVDTRASTGGGQHACRYLDTLYDPENTFNANCSSDDHTNCKVGELTGKHGLVKIGSSNSRYSKKLFVDTHLPLIDLGTRRSIFVAIYDETLNVIACGKIITTEPRNVRARFSSDGVGGYVGFSQQSPFDPTVVTVNVTNVQGRGKAYHVHSFPRPYRVTDDQNMCDDLAVGGHFNPHSVDVKSSPVTGFGTSDQYEVGDLSGKFGSLSGGGGEDVVDDYYVDFNLPMFGTNSIVGRSVVIHNPFGGRWICASIEYPANMRTAVATFYYPVIGHVVMRQEKDNPFGDTTVFAELSYNDGTKNNTRKHRWDVHTNKPSKDFYDWQNRCLSVKGEYNPYNVGTKRLYKRYCSADNPLRCSLGDLTSKIGTINVAARKGSMQNKVMYTDTNLALSGPYGIIGRSLVIHDDKAPEHRGDRLACTPIYEQHPIRAKVSVWYVDAGISSRVTGTIDLFQETRDDPTKVSVDLQGLDGLAGGYHIHKWPVPENLEFPCTDDAVSGHFNPFDVDSKVGPNPGIGSFDQYEMGDLSGKYGTLKERSSYTMSTTDVTLPLSGPNSVLGRSVVIHKDDRNFRWVCGDVEPDVKVDDPQKIVAMASFSQLEGYLRGYVRLSQLIYPDGSSSDTTVEVMLRYPGKNNRNVTTGHKWSVYVNQVGADAEVKSERTRCIAAGYLWDPYLVYTDNEEAYRMDCNRLNPLRCEMGDLTGRHGLLTVGVGRNVFTDINLPLSGNASVLGRSIVIHSKNRSPNSLGCGNIIKEGHVVKRVTIRKPRSFGSREFMDKIRDALDSFEWLIYSEARSVKYVQDGQCIELTVHFRGSDAFGLSEEFTKLMNTGKIRKHTRLGAKNKKIRYRLCNQVHSSAMSSVHSVNTSTMMMMMTIVLKILGKFYIV